MFSGKKKKFSMVTSKRNQKLTASTSATRLDIIRLQVVRFLGELTGTAMIVGLGCMGCIGNDNASSNVLLQNGLIFGLIIMVAMQVFGFVSGGHANPCVTLCCFVLGHLPLSITLFYIIAQFLGAILGYGMLIVLLPSQFIDGKQAGLCMTVPNVAITDEQAFAIEFVLTSVLVFGWCALWDIRNSRFLDSVSLRVGLLVTCLIMTGVSLVKVILFSVPTTFSSITWRV